MTHVDPAAPQGLLERQAPNANKVLLLLAAANVLNFYDRTIPAVLVEPVKEAFDLTDTHIGILSGSFVIVYAIVGIYLGRLADRRSRRQIMGWGLVVWSVMTAVTGGAWSFVSLFIIRLGVGIGEASYAPAANSMISDLFSPAKRSKAIAIFQMGIPIGTILAFFTTGAITEATGTFRAPFFIAAIPGLALAVLLFRIDEPARGASDGASIHEIEKVDRPQGVIRDILRIPTMRWLILAGIGLQLAAGSIATFLVPYFQRYFDLSLTSAAVNAGVIIGVASLFGLVAAGPLAERAARRSARHRVLLGAIALLVSAPISLGALLLGSDHVALFVLIFSAVYFLQFFFHTTAYPAVSDVVAPASRSTAIAVFFAAFYLLGGAFGPIITGILSEIFAGNATAGALSTEAIGLRSALLVMVPLAIVLTAVGLFGAARTIERDQQKMLETAQAQAD